MLVYAKVIHDFLYDRQPQEMLLGSMRETHIRSCERLDSNQVFREMNITMIVPYTGTMRA